MLAGFITSELHEAVAARTLEDVDPEGAREGSAQGR
jgi:hypothetical protein